MPTIVGLAEFHEVDCRDLLRNLRVAGQRPDLIFADPPFNIGQDYQHGDRMSKADFESFTVQWVNEAVMTLRPGGALWVNVPDEMVSNIDTLVRNIAGIKMERKNWVIWHFRFGQHTDGRFVRSKSHLLYFVKDGPNRVFNTEDIRVASVRQEIGDLRSAPSGRTPMDVWGFENFWGRVQGNSHERVPDAPNQLPEVLLERIILACSNKGDLVVDPFCGSGTTAVVGSTLGRRVITSDNSERILHTAVDRCKKGSVRCDPLT